MPFYRFKGFVADVMLYLAGILNGGLLIDPELFEQLGEKRMALVHFFGYFSAAVGESDVAAAVDEYVVAALEQTDRTADAGL